MSFKIFARKFIKQCPPSSVNYACYQAQMSEVLTHYGYWCVDYGIPIDEEDEIFSEIKRIAPESYRIFMFGKEYLINVEYQRNGV